MGAMDGWRLRCPLRAYVKNGAGRVEIGSTNRKHAYMVNIAWTQIRNDYRSFGSLRFARFSEQEKLVLTPDYGR